MTSLPPTIDTAIKLILRTHQPSDAVTVLQAKGWNFDADALAQRIQSVAQELGANASPRSAPTPATHQPSFVRPKPQPWHGLDLSVLPTAVTELVEATPSAFVEPAGAGPSPTAVVDDAWQECLPDMLTALNDEIEAANERLNDGRAQATRGVVLGTTQQGVTVSYELDRDLGLAEGAQVQVYFEGRTLDAEVITVAGEAVHLWVRTDTPPIPSAVVIADASFLLSLRRRFLSDTATTGSALGAAMSRFTSVRDVASPAVVTPDSSSLTDDQRRFVQEALSNDLTWLWGPPGTGKTTALAHLVSALRAADKRVLFVSNTNAAVDTALLRYASISTHYVMGDVVRPGEPALREVKDLSTPVLIDQISSVRGDPIARALVQCKADIARLRKQNLDRLALIEPDRGFKSTDADDAPEAPDDLDIARRRDRHFDDSRAIAPEVGFLIERRNTLEELLSRLQSAVVDTARVVFATVHRCYLRTLQGQRFDCVIVDEASMLSTDLTLIAAAMSTGGVVVAGDFRQLGPIAMAQTPAAKRWLRQSIFEEVGITHEVSTGRLRPGLVALREQHRMRLPIETLIGKEFYPEIGLTGSPRIAARTSTGLTDLPASALLMFDTSSLHPWMAKRAGRWSRFNVMHAQLATELLHHIPETASFGLVSPFAAQARLLKAVVQQDDALRCASTVHRFQGGERDIMLWDTTWGAAGRSRTNPWFLATKPHEEGFRLINVALSRARDQLGVIADMQHLKAELHESTTVRRALSFIEQHGEHVDVGQLLVDGRTTRLGRGQANGHPLARLLDDSVGHVVIWSSDAPRAIAPALQEAIARARANGTAVYLRCQVPKTTEQSRVVRDLQACGVSVRYLQRVTENVAVGTSSVLSSPYSLLSVAEQQVWLETASASMGQALTRLLKRTADPAFADGAADPTCPSGHPTLLMRGLVHDYVPERCLICHPATPTRSRAARLGIQEIP